LNPTTILQLGVYQINIQFKGFNFYSLFCMSIDIQGLEWPKPRFLTKAKMRWDSKYLYIGGYVQEPDVWANQTKHDSVGE
jgi:hypothetical protein